MSHGEPILDPRSRILSAASRLIAEGGTEAATTRAVASAAEVQAPTIYRLFGDKEGLLEAVAERTMADYIVEKGNRVSSGDPVKELRDGWDTHIAFGLAHPSIFGIMSGATSMRPSRAASAGLEILRDRVRRVARTGRLRVTEERAVDLLHAMGTGTVLTLLEKSIDQRTGLSDAARDAVFAAIISPYSQAVERGTVGAASALRADLRDIDALTAGERELLGELLERIAGAGSA